MPEIIIPADNVGWGNGFWRLCGLAMTTLAGKIHSFADEFHQFYRYAAPQEKFRKLVSECHGDDHL